MQMALAHANRIATIGQLTASIAHELTSLSLLWRPMEAPPCGGSRDSHPASTKQEALSST
jgi:hypothetical protein